MADVVISDEDLQIPCSQCLGDGMAGDITCSHCDGYGSHLTPSGRAIIDLLKSRGVAVPMSPKAEKTTYARWLRANYD